jgi:tungstate transport system ATP-binding protein
LNLIEIEKLFVSKAGKAICAMPALEIRASERLLVTGTNGSGKTTLLRTIAGLEKDFAGRLTRHIPLCDTVYVHQQACLFRGTVRFNVGYGVQARGWSATDQEEAINRWLEHFQIQQLAHSSVRSLSGGERRRVVLARAFAIKPRLLLLDEPLAELDQAGKDCLLQAITESPGRAVVIASPIVEELFKQAFTQIVCRKPPTEETSL